MATAFSGTRRKIIRRASPRKISNKFEIFTRLLRRPNLRFSSHHPVLKFENERRQIGVFFVRTASNGRGNTKKRRDGAFQFEFWCTIVKEVATMLKEDLMGENYPSYLYFFH